DGHEPRREGGEVAPVPVARDPRLLERERRQVLGHGAVTDPVAEVVVDARQLVRVQRVPVRLPGRFQRPGPAEHHVADGHRWKCTPRRPGYHGPRSPRPPMQLAARGPGAVTVSAILLGRRSAPLPPDPRLRSPALARFYITTAIDYVNGRPHLGHAYEKVLGDAIARRHRQRGDATYYLTGTDEHGQKIARAAAAANKTPAAFVDELSQTFVSAWKVLGVQYDQFFRTTDTKHRLAVQELFRRLKDALSPKTGQPVLYEEAYEGLYCEGCEGFKTEKDLDEQGRCLLHKVKPREV